MYPLLILSLVYFKVNYKKSTILFDVLFTIDYGPKPVNFDVNL